MLTCCHSPGGATPSWAGPAYITRAVGGRQDEVGIDLSVVRRTVWVAEERRHPGGQGEQ